MRANRKAYARDNVPLVLRDGPLRRSVARVKIQGMRLVETAVSRFAHTRRKFGIATGKYHNGSFPCNRALELNDDRWRSRECRTWVRGLGDRRISMTLKTLDCYTR